MMAPDGPRTVMVAGSTSAAGTAVVSALSGAGFRVAAVRDAPDRSGRELVFVAEAA